MRRPLPGREPREGRSDVVRVRSEQRRAVESGDDDREPRMPDQRVRKFGLRGGEIVDRAGLRKRMPDQLQLAVQFGLVEHFEMPGDEQVDHVTEREQHRHRHCGEEDRQASGDRDGADHGSSGASRT